MSADKSCTVSFRLAKEIPSASTSNHCSIPSTNCGLAWFALMNAFAISSFCLSVQRSKTNLIGGKEFVSPAIAQVRLQKAVAAKVKCSSPNWSGANVRSAEFESRTYFLMPSLVNAMPKPCWVYLTDNLDELSEDLLAVTVGPFSPWMLGSISPATFTVSAPRVAPAPSQLRHVEVYEPSIPGDCLPCGFNFSLLLRREDKTRRQ